MGLGWRRAFCTSIPRERKMNEEQQPHTNPTTPKKHSSKLGGFFSTPSTPRSQSPLRSNPSSPSTFSLLKSTLRLSKSRCGICLHTVKSGDGTPIFTAECSHTFHFHCIVSHFNNQSHLTCPICTSSSSVDQNKRDISPTIDYRTKQHGRTHHFKVYNDDEPLMSPTSLAHFNPIPEFDENGDEETDTEFQGFFVDATTASSIKRKSRNIEVRLLPEAAVVSIGRSYETCALVLTVKAPALDKVAPRAPIDLVTVLDVSGNMNAVKMQMMKRAMRLLLSALSAADRFSIVAFSATSKRLLPLRRMTTNGRRAARRIIDALAILEGGPSCTGDALKKASKVLEDRREKNPGGSIMIFSSIHDEESSFNQRQQLPLVSSTRHPHLDIAVHRIRFEHGGACQQAPSADSFAKCARDLLGVAVEDVKLQLGLLRGSTPAEIAAVYLCSTRPETLDCSSTRIGDLYAEEEREFLVELKLPSSSIGSHRVMSVQCCYKDPSTQQIVYNKQVSLLIPRPDAVRSSAPNIQRLRSLFISTRAAAESRRLIDRSDLNGAYYMLSSARALLLQAGSVSAKEFAGGLEAELKEVEKKVQQSEKQGRSSIVKGRELVFVDEKGEPLTPTSAWRAAEKLAKVAAMRKSLNKVSDLHGFEDARF